MNWVDSLRDVSGRGWEYRARLESAARREKWRRVPGRPHYEVSDRGFVRRLRSYGGVRPLRRCLSRDGYWTVGLSEDAAVTFFRVHRLVALAFIGPPPTPKHEVDHIDGDRQNADVSNLEWVTKSENVRRAHARRKLTS